MQRKINSNEYYGDIAEDKSEGLNNRMEIVEEESEGGFSDGGNEEGNTSNNKGLQRKRPKPPRLTKNQTLRGPPQITLEIPW
jgi:hypothetical protein